jgi:gamma-glutamyltranspeptidase / glutathione hydrolase
MTRASSIRPSIVVVGIALTSCFGERPTLIPAPTPVVASAVPPASAPTSAPPVARFPEGWPYPASGPTVTASKGMVVSDARLATEVGRDVLAAGGNAVDAAVATAFALAVVLPTAGNIGGGGFLVARVGGAPYALNFREVAPLAAKHDMYLGKDGKPNGASHQGYRASGVPGSRTLGGIPEARVEDQDVGRAPRPRDSTRGGGIRDRRRARGDHR